MKTDHEKKVECVKNILIDIRTSITHEYISNAKLRIFALLEGFRIGERELKYILHELRNNGNVPLLIASGRGYKFCENTEEMRAYLKRLHKIAMQHLRLFSHLKEQAELVLGMQVDMPFWNELYQEKTND